MYKQAENACKGHFSYLIINPCDTEHSLKYAFHAGDIKEYFYIYVYGTHYVVREMSSYHWFLTEQERFYNGLLMKSALPCMLKALQFFTF